MTKETNNVRAWTFHKKFSDFESADKVRSGLQAEGLEVRVRKRHADGSYDVKKRASVKGAAS